MLKALEVSKKSSQPRPNNWLVKDQGGLGSPSNPVLQEQTDTVQWKTTDESDALLFFFDDDPSRPGQWRPAKPLKLNGTSDANATHWIFLKKGIPSQVYQPTTTSGTREGKSYPYLTYLVDTSFGGNKDGDLADNNSPPTIIIVDPTEPPDQPVLPDQSEAGYNA